MEQVPKYPLMELSLLVLSVQENKRHLEAQEPKL